MEAACVEAGMPEVLDQKIAVARAWRSICGQRDCLNEAVSGPCSWMKSALLTASESDVAMRRRERWFSVVESLPPFEGAAPEPCAQEEMYPGRWLAM